MPKMSQSNFGVMRIFYELRYTINELMRTFYLKGVPARFQRYLRHIYWVINGTSSSKLSCNPRHPSRIISCNHRQHLLQPSWRRIFSTSNNQKTRRRNGGRQRNQPTTFPAQHTTIGICIRSSCWSFLATKTMVCSKMKDKIWQKAQDKMHFYWRRNLLMTGTDIDGTRPLSGFYSLPLGLLCAP